MNRVSGGLLLLGASVILSLFTLLVLVASAAQRPIPSASAPEVVAVQQGTYATSPTPEQTLVIERFEVLEDEGSFAGVNIVVVNLSDSVQTGVIWYLLSPPYATVDAWRIPNFTAAQQRFTFAPNEQRLIAFDEPGVSVIGLFRLSMWVHVIDEEGVRVHADAMGYETLVIVEPHGGFGDGLLQQLETQREQVVVPPLTLDGDVQTVQVEFVQSRRSLQSVNASLINTNPDGSREVFLSYMVDAAENPEPWRHPVFTSVETKLTLEPNQTLPVNFSVPETLAPGSYRFALWKRSSLVEPPVIAAEHIFQIDPLFTFALADETGQVPLVLSMSSIPTTGENGFTMPFALRNESDQDRIVGVFYSVVPDDSLVPWRTAFFSMPLRFFSLNEKETHIFTDTRNIHVPSGTYNVIAWAVELVDARLILRAAYSRDLHYVAP